MPDSFSIEAIFKKYKDRIYRLALSITRNEKDAEDILQNTFIKIIKNLKNFKAQAHISTWIYKITYNEALMSLRKKERQFRLSKYLRQGARKKLPGLFINWSKLPDEQLLDTEFKQRLDFAIKHIPIKYRMPLLLNKVEELPLKDTAKILGLKLNSLKTRLHRAHLIIKEELSDYLKDREEKELRQDNRCNIWMGFVYDYAKGYLGKQRQLAFNRHIKDCLGCQAFLDTYLKAIHVTKALQCQDLPIELQNKIETFLSLKHQNYKKGGKEWLNR